MYKKMKLSRAQIEEIIRKLNDIDMTVQSFKKLIIEIAGFSSTEVIGVIASNNNSKIKEFEEMQRQIADDNRRKATVANKYPKYHIRNHINDKDMEC